MDKSDARGRWLHWGRLFIALAVGVVAGGLALGQKIPSGASGLIGWNAAALTYLVFVGRLILTADERFVRARARQEDENRAILMSVIMVAALASLGAMVLALHDVKAGGKQGLPPWIVALSASTLVLSWMTVQALFTLHYTHRFFGDRDDDGSDDAGIKFPGQQPTTYRDFLYVAVCVGATCQVSDFDIATSRMRNLVTVHALIAFAFNTMVLALGINIIGNLMGSG